MEWWSAVRSDTSQVHQTLHGAMAQSFAEVHTKASALKNKERQNWYFALARLILEVLFHDSHSAVFDFPRTFYLLLVRNLGICGVDCVFDDRHSLILCNVDRKPAQQLLFGTFIPV
jgi:hypothetical protein